jgi:hypothetical protein
MISHHDQISIPEITKRASQLHEPLTIIHRVLKHDRAFEVVRFNQQAVRDQLVLAVHFDCHLRCGSRKSLDGSERHASISPRRDEPLHMESVLAIGENWMKWANGVSA